MANIKELKVRIGSTKSTLKITSAMKLVSAAKLNKAQMKIKGFKPYSQELDKTVRVASALVDNYSHEYLTENDSKKTAVLVISSNRGLCGGYNSQLAKKITSHITENTEKEYLFYFVGKKVKDLLARIDISAEKSYEAEGKEITYSEIESVAKDMAELFTTAKVSNVLVAYNSFVSVIEFNPTVKQVLPMTVSAEDKEELLKEFPVDFKYEPSPKEILDSVIPDVMVTTIFTALLDAVAAEHATRMTAMDNATNNSKDMIKNLTLTMNKLRQAAITTELTEIVSGAESLNG
jgi:F-type H+-transporting ATPase subunit gamma